MGDAAETIVRAYQAYANCRENVAAIDRILTEAEAAASTDR